MSWEQAEAMYILDIAGGDCQHPWLVGRVTTGSGGSRGTGEPAPGSSCGWAGAVPACAGTELCTPRVCWWGVCWCCYVGAASSTGKYLSAEKETRLVSTVLVFFFFFLSFFPVYTEWGRCSDGNKPAQHIWLRVHVCACQLSTLLWCWEGISDHHGPFQA